MLVTFESNKCFCSRISSFVLSFAHSYWHVVVSSYSQDCPYHVNGSPGFSWFPDYCHRFLFWKAASPSKETTDISNLSIMVEKDPAMSGMRFLLLILSSTLMLLAIYSIYLIFFPFSNLTVPFSGMILPLTLFYVIAFSYSLNVNNFKCFKALKENCNAKTNWFHLKGLSKSCKIRPKSLKIHWAVLHDF